MPKGDPILQVTESFVGALNGHMVSFREGELIEAEHPAVRQWPEKFGPIRQLHRAPRVAEPAPVIEEATSPAARKRGADGPFPDAPGSGQCRRRRPLPRGRHGHEGRRLCRANSGAMPTEGARHLTITHTTVGGADTLGKITFVGTNLAGETITEDIVPVAAASPPARSGSAR